VTGNGQPLILIADDDPDILALVSFRLERAGYEVVQARNGEEAVQVALARRPDLAVIDVMMPRTDGYEATRQLRQQEETSRMPIILLTARAGGGHRAGFRRRRRRLRQEAVQPSRARLARSGSSRPIAVTEATNCLDRGIARGGCGDLLAQIPDVELRPRARAR
jgi:CheY-like chemotaxis protein